MDYKERLASGESLASLATRAVSKERLAALHAQVRQPRGNGVLLNEGDLVDGLGVVVCAAYLHEFDFLPEETRKKGDDTPPPVLPEEVSIESFREAARSLLADKLEAIDYVAAHELGTHTQKGIDSEVGGRALMAESSVSPDAGTFLSGSFLGQGPRLGASGNAANGRTHALLTSRFRLGNSETCIASALAEGNGKVIDALVALVGEDRREGVLKAAKTLQGRAENLSAPSASGRAKTLLWPTVNGEYLAITPVTSFSTQIELHEEINRRREQAKADDVWTFFNRLITQVGGTKPQNVSSANVTIRGRLSLLDGLPPRARKGEVDRLVHRMGKGGSLIRHSLPAELTAKVLVAARREHAINVRMATLQSAIVLAAVRLLLVDLLTVSEAYTPGIEEGWEKPLKHEAAFVRNGPAELGESKVPFVEVVVDRLASVIHKDLKQVPGDPERACLRDYVAQALDAGLPDNGTEG